MFEIDEDLKQKFKATVDAIKIRFDKKPERDFLRDLIIKENLGKFRKGSKLGADILSNIVEKGGVAGIDGSTNSSGGIFPYVITLQHTLAKSCNVKDKEITLTDAFSPLLDDDSIIEEEYRIFVKQNLTKLEVATAIIALEEFKPKVLLMDGSLVRFKIEASDLWDNLTRKAIEMDCLLIGVVEGISTDVLSANLKGSLPKEMTSAQDWELLFGLLNIGEILEIVPGLFKEGFRTCFMRPSFDPKPIGLDLIEEQQNALRLAEDIVITLSPKDGRGIPLWLDIIDSEVRISDKMIEELTSFYLGEEYIEFLKPKRQNRKF